MTTKLSLTVLAFAALGTMACGTYNSTKVHNVRQPVQTHLEPLTRAQIVVNDVVEGQACARFTALWPIPIWWAELPKDPAVGGADGSSLTTMLTGNSTADNSYRVMMFARATNMARSAAKQVALRKAQNPDMVISEYYIDEAVYGRWWKRKVCSKAIVKTATIRPDSTLTPDERMDRPVTTNAVVVGGN